MPVPLNFRHLMRQARRSLFGTRGTHRRLTPHRIGVLLVFWLLFIPHQIITRICLLLDNLFFPGWRRIRVENPVFITGLFRSGTTYLHRLLASHDPTFTAFKTWEIYLAPSVLQRRLLKGWKELDRILGSPARKWLEQYNQRNLGNIRFHQVGLWKEEEDEGLFLFAWDSLFTWFFFPDTEGMDDYIFADHEMPARRQQRKWKFYRECVKRHMYAHPESKVYLSKNPAFTPKIAGLREAFPDARIVYLVRDPLRVLVSQSAWFSFVWHYFASPVEEYPFREKMLEMTSHWYSYPLEVLEKDPLATIIRYPDLIDHPKTVFTRLYSGFNLRIPDSLAAEVQNSSRQSDEYASAGNLKPEDLGFSPEEIERQFSRIYAEFDLIPGE